MASQLRRTIEQKVTRMKIAYEDKLRLNVANKERLETINSIIEEYLADDYILTLRQLYYQLVSRDVIPNNQKEYSKLSILLKKGRMAGIVDWDAIEDRGRQPKLPYYVTGVKDALNDTVEQYRIDRMKDQEKYIEVWVEKEALSNVFLRVTEQYHIRLMVNKGYSSCSAMHESFKRFKQNMLLNEQAGLIFYFGDHDPSGIDMARDIKDRMDDFGINAIGQFAVLRPALTIAQVRQFKCPKNPAKMTDPRAGWYVKEHGYKSWELDALPPRSLIQIITRNIENHIDVDLYKEQIKIEERQKKVISDFAKKIKDDQ